MTIDLGYINQFGIDVAGNVQNIETLASSIISSMTIPAEAKCIDSIYLDFEIIGKKAVETRTYNWARLGELLFNLQDRYNNDPSINRVKVSWTKFAAENFTNFGKKRREQAVKLYNYGKELEKYYFLGIDELLYVFNLLIGKHRKDKEGLKKTGEMFEFSFNSPVDTDEDRRIFREKVDKICAYEKDFDAVKKTGADNELYYRCVSVGCVVNKKVISHIGSLASQAEKDAYMKESIANRDFKISNNENTTEHAQASPGLLCKLIDNTSGYRTKGLDEVKHLGLDIVTQAIRELVWLRKELRNM
ncbi:hypothetical protein [Desulfovibrio sp. DV]|uniref:hypothetical protein n=1 Tax=Desulfovibrio sp. DV TaxID=1844708 RepID=UPI00094BC04C|nr:hypothetical protein [Desulfovibrio sp. DV]